MSSVTTLPLRFRVTTREGAAMTPATFSHSSSCPAPEIPSRHPHDETASCSEGARSSIAAAALTSIPTGSASERRAGSSARSIVVPSTSSRSRYSASDSAPVGRASPKLTLGRGAKPPLYATGSCVRRNARSNMRAKSRWLVHLTLPALV